MRGHQIEDLKHLRRVLKRPDVQVARTFFEEETFVTGPERDELIARVVALFQDETYLNGGGFELAEFRDDDGGIVLLVEEYC
jgi:hypothetical protein